MDRRGLAPCRLSYDGSGFGPHARGQNGRASGDQPWRQAGQRMSIIAHNSDATRAKAAASGQPLVDVEELRVKFVSRDATVWAVNGVSFQLMPGEVLCLIGESGSGKTVTMRALMRLLP